MTSAPSEIKLKRFLHYGRETPLYQPGDRYIHKYYERNNVTSIEELIAEDKVTDPVVHIMKAFSDGYSAHPQSLVFALALCVRQDKNDALRQAAYGAIKTVCKAPKDLFLFVKFAFDLSNPKSGCGHGWRRAIIDWYLKKEPMELAECVSRYRGRHGWTHRDIIKLSHPKAGDIAMAAVLRYVVRGMEDAKLQFGDKPEAQSVLTYLQTIEDFKHSEDEQHAARLIETHSLTLDHVPGRFLKSKEVWNALVPHLPLDVILQNLKRLGRLRFLKGNQPLVNKVVQALNKQSAITQANLHPAQVLVALCNYENLAKPNTPRQHSTEPETKPKVPLQPHPKVVEALNQLLVSTFKLLVPTGLRYLVAIDVRNQVTHTRCWNCTNVLSSQAVVLMTLCLVKAERDVTVVAFSTDGAMQPVELGKDMSMKEAQVVLREIPNGPVDLTVPLFWAKTIRKEVDVFIMLTDTQVKPQKPRITSALKQYREALKLPNTKMVTCGFGLPKFNVASPEDPGMFDVAGFDGQVPRVVEAFCRGAF